MNPGASATDRADDALADALTGPIVMLIIILESVGVPTEGIGLIIGVDRILDMCRSATNVTGDSTVASVVAASENQLFPPPARSLVE